MIIVNQFRAGAPDKISLFHNPEIQFNKLDNTNLVDLDIEEIKKKILANEYFLPADEGDILKANELYEEYKNYQFKILLPQTFDQELNCYRVLAYEDYVPKDSSVYDSLEEATGVIYPSYNIYEIEEFKNSEKDLLENCAVKTTVGSGSRGVALIDESRIHLGGKFYSSYSEVDWDALIEYAKSQPEYCRIMVQNLIPNEERLTKCNVDFIMKGGNLLTYKWDKTDPTAVFTNWNFGWFIKNEYTDTVVSSIARHLSDNGITDAIMNFECYSDLESETWMVEFNWRYSNSMFEWQAFNYDPIYGFIKGLPCEIPEGEHKFSRYWQCGLVSDLIG